ncbi:Homocysteine S-methyltransferase 1 [Allomyces javanicus]|nr:Homocysteine S-methyltransferase 1 [Allomyces javanicus]
MTMAPSSSWMAQRQAHFKYGTTHSCLPHQRAVLPKVQLSTLQATINSTSKMWILDGAFAEELVRVHGKAITNTPLWSASCITTDPSAIQTVHASYLAAGADIFLTSTYQAAPGNLSATYKIDRAAAESILRQGVQLALDVRDKSAVPGKQVALSLGSFGATLADGSEFTGAFAKTTTRAELAAFHADRLRAFGAEILGKVDWLAFETVPTLVEVHAILDALRDARAEGLPVAPAWISVSARNDAETGAGDAIETVARAIADAKFGTVSSLPPFNGKPFPSVILGINCTPPEYLTGLLRKIHAAQPNVPVVVYPNIGEEWDGAKRCWIEGSGWTDDEYARIAKEEWTPLGVVGVGGCCRTTPSTIRALRRAFGGEASDKAAAS